MEDLYKRLKVINTSSYRLVKNNKCYDIINYGEIHGFDSKINFNIFKDNKTCFYTETFINSYQKNYMYEYFIKSNSKKHLKEAENFNNSIGVRPKTGYNNLYHLQKYFAYFYKKNGFNFLNEQDKKIVEKSKPYNKLWNYFPCDCRENYDKSFHTMNSLLYTILTYYVFKKMEYPKSFDYFINNKDNERFKIDDFKQYTKINIKPENLKNYYNALKEKFNLYTFKNDEMFVKISDVYKKYFNKDYDNFINDNSDENLNNYFKNINLTEMMLDLFNVQTYFYYENILIKYKSITDFLNNYFEFGYKTSHKGIITFYDILLYINLNNNLEKAEYHVIYNGDFHRQLFNMYIYSLCKYEGFERMI